MGRQDLRLRGPAHRCRRSQCRLAGADGVDHDRAFRRERPRLRRRRAADGEPRVDLGDAVPARRRDRTTHVDRRVPAARRHGARTAGARDRADDDGDHRAGGSRVQRVCRGVPRAGRRLPAALALRGRRRVGHGARGDVHAAADLRRAPPGHRLGGVGRGFGSASR